MSQIASTDLDERLARRTRSQAESLLRMLRITRALVASRRPVDLAGLDHQVGLLCARMLDLPPHCVQLSRNRLIAVRSELDVLAETLRQHRPDG